MKVVIIILGIISLAASLYLIYAKDTGGWPLLINLFYAVLVIVWVNTRQKKVRENSSRGQNEITDG